MITCWREETGWVWGDRCFESSLPWPLASTLKLIAFQQTLSRPGVPREWTLSKGPGLLDLSRSALPKGAQNIT